MCPVNLWGAAMTHHKLLLTTAICSAVAIGAPFGAQAAITTTTTTTHSYDFPGGSPSVSSSSSTVENCPVYYNDSSDSGSDSRSTGGGWVDTNGDGRGDTWSGHATSGSYNSSETRGGYASGSTNISSYGHVSGSHDNGYEGRSNQSGGSSSSSGGSSGSGSGSGSSKVLCTYFYHKDMLARKIWLADLKYARDFLKPETIRGYHAWAVPLVAYLQNGHHPVLEKIIFPIVNGWAHQMAYKVGLIDKPNVVGAILTATAEPLCYLIGLFAPARDYDKLWA